MWFLHTEFTRLKAPLTSVSSKAVLERQTQEANKDRLGKLLKVLSVIIYYNFTLDVMIIVESIMILNS